MKLPTCGGLFAAHDDRDRLRQDLIAMAKKADELDTEIGAVMCTNHGRPGADVPDKEKDYGGDYFLMQGCEGELCSVHINDACPYNKYGDPWPDGEATKPEHHNPRVHVHPTFPDAFPSTSDVLYPFGFRDSAPECVLSMQGNNLTCLMPGYNNKRTFVEQVERINKTNTDRAMKEMLGYRETINRQAEFIMEDIQKVIEDIPDEYAFLFGGFCTVNLDEPIDRAEFRVDYDRWRKGRYG
jgi:hypothetical protein